MVLDSFNVIFQLIAYIWVGLDLGDSRIIELSGISMPVLDAVFFLDTSSVALTQAAFVHVVNPCEMGHGGSGVDTRLEGDDVLPGNDVALLRCRCSESSWEQGSKEESETTNVNHCEACKEAMRAESER